jgi:hypothetical protein
VADKDRAAREAALLAAARRSASERLRQAPLNPAAHPPQVKAQIPAPKAAAAPQLTAEERLMRLMEAERLERDRESARTRRNAMILLFLFAVPILLWLLLSLLRR